MFRTEAPGVGVSVSLPQGHSSIGRASVSKTEGWGFEALCPCHIDMNNQAGLTGTYMAEKIKLLLAGLLVVAGIAGFYFLSDSPTVVRVLAVLAGLVLAAAVAWYTEAGRAFYGFSRESADEARKVVWPTRKETLQVTGVVMLFVVVMALFLWLVDAGLLWLVKLLMGRGE